jgi:hypothetical protein
MTAQDTAFNLELSRRKLLAAAGIAGGAAVAASFIGTSGALAAPGAPPSPDPLTPPPVTGLHLQFGADAASEMVVSWHALQSVRNPRVMLGTLDGKLDRVVAAKETSYIDAKSGQVVYAFMRKSASCRPAPLICTGHPTRALRRSSARSELPRAVARASRSPASGIRPRRLWARSTSRPRG